MLHRKKKKEFHEMDNANTDSSMNDSKRMIKVSWVMAITGIATAIIATVALIISWFYFSEQIKEMHFATTLEWRPYLNIQHLGVTGHFKAGPGEFRDVDTIVTRSGTKEKLEILQIAENALQFKVAWKYSYSNKGKTYLRLTKSYETMFSDSSWVNKYLKSDRIIIDSIIKLGKAYNWEVDYILFPGDSAKISSLKDAQVSIPLSKLYSIMDSDSTLVLYLASYFEYSDQFNQTITYYLLKV